MGCRVMSERTGFSLLNDGPWLVFEPPRARTLATPSGQTRSPTLVLIAHAPEGPTSLSSQPAPGLAAWPAQD